MPGEGDVEVVFVPAGVSRGVGSMATGPFDRSPPTPSVPNGGIDV